MRILSREGHEYDLRENEIKQTGSHDGKLYSARRSDVKWMIIKAGDCPSGLFYCNGAPFTRIVEWDGNALVLGCQSFIGRNLEELERWARG